MDFGHWDGCWGNEVGTCSSSPDSDRISFHFYNGHAMVEQVHLALPLPPLVFLLG
eukprot:m.243761 g.243761  ORF g.243761 m.243761 type:complete len:55 (-) comp22553_c4_seq2:137-301(-)